MKKLPLGFWLILLALGSGYQGYTNRGYYPDDAYIPLRYGYNLVAEKGWCYNQGERINASTSPLNTLLAVLTALIAKDHPELFRHLLDEIFLLSLLIMIGVLFWQEKKYLSVILAPALMISDPLLHRLYGLETLLMLALAFASLMAYQKKSFWLGPLLGLMILARPDTTLLALIIFLLQSKEQKKIPSRDLGLTLLILLPWLIFSWAYFHSLFPNTLFAKMAQARSGLWINYPFYLGLWGLWEQFYPKIFYKAGLTLCALLGAYEAIRRQKVIGILILWAFIHMLAYTALRVPDYPWYFAPMELAWLLMIGIGAEKIYELFHLVIRKNQRITRELLRIIALVIALTLVYPHLRLVKASSNLKLQPREKAYSEIGKWLAQNTSPQQSLLVIDIGAVGFYSQRKIIDASGLLSPKPIIRELKSARFDLLFQYNQPDLYLYHQNLYPIEQLLFKKLPQNYEQVRIFQFEDYTPMVLVKIHW